ncbi:hypothetical protein GDO81_018217 [Engystomops pustulosus]|uniref:Secreted protein n=1 Tax=Engystomops pustulosus TaxID=76066 RepID=A0AAV7ABC6_ENGPU|nr:hypothetical protein GDO81_018217 [Engystomops pustulosus]
MCILEAALSLLPLPCHYDCTNAWLNIGHHNLFCGSGRRLEQNFLVVCYITAFSVSKSLQYGLLIVICILLYYTQ